VKKLERLRQEIKLGLDEIKAGKVAPLDIEKIKAEGRSQLAAGRRKKS
jgi:hypothetical protein